MRLAVALRDRGILTPALLSITVASPAVALAQGQGQGQGFSYEDMGCEGDAGPACPRRYRISGGPGYVGHRASWPTHAAWETSMFCSPSCVAGASTAGACALIVAMHGIYSNPSDQRWLMLGGDVALALDEDEANGGPYCITFPKAKDDAWDYNCFGDDAAHLEGLIRWSLDEFPSLDPHAVNLHGFSSGAIMTHNLMDTSCPIEGLVSAAAPYAGGWVSSPPTTKAAYLTIHGTHDNIVTYGASFDDDRNRMVPFCAVSDPGFFDPERPFAEFDSPILNLFGESLAAGVAKYRGYGGDVLGPAPVPVGTLDLIDESGRPACETTLANCIHPSGEDPYYQPSPWNDLFSCDAYGGAETDVIDYPVDPGSKPVRVWRINIHNHDYPNRRRIVPGWGPAEIFIQMRIFFNENRGPRPPKAERIIVEDSDGVVCANPGSFTGDDKEVFHRRLWGNDPSSGGVTPELCSERCRADEECVESFYYDFAPWYFDVACSLHYRFAPCLSTTTTDHAARHFVTAPGAPTTSSPTKAPTRKPTQPPMTQPPPSSDSGLCQAPAILFGSNPAGYSCLPGLGDSNIGTTAEDCANSGGEWERYDCETANNYWLSMGGPAWEHAEHFQGSWSEHCCATPNSSPDLCQAPADLCGTNYAGHSCVPELGDSNIGTTAQDCANDGGDWEPYDCNTANNYWLSVGGPAWEYADFFQESWSGQCCSTTCPPPAPTTPAPTPAATPSGFCPASSPLLGSNPAGYSCLNGLGDSNAGFTAEKCASVGGEWQEYDCATADSFWQSVGGWSYEYASTFGPAWANLCCWSNPVPQNLSPSCPSTCTFPNCVYLGEDGPGWDPSWTGDNGGTPTKNGFCTSFCKDYEEGKYLCGDGEWHRTGVDCSGCAGLADDPIVPTGDRAPASGMCAAAEGLSGHILWGSGIRECSGGPEATDDTRCTVFQALNGDEVVNPGRTCGSFCSHFGFSCINGYDNAEYEWCTYGGAGIGCDDVLGTGSVGGPTPDHVCVCGPELGPSNFFIACGNSAACYVPPLAASVEEEHEVRCCSDTNLGRGWKKNAGCNVWGKSIINGQCHASETFEVAEAKCASINARLCTEDEMTSDCTKGTGCQFDFEMIWTSTPVPSSPCADDSSCDDGLECTTNTCGADGACRSEVVPGCTNAVVGGAPAGNIWSGERVREADPTEQYAVRCCSDNFNPNWKKHASCNVWAESDVPECYISKTLTEAENICTNAGGRLCTEEEVLGDCTVGSGCQFDFEYLWTSSRYTV